MLQAVSGYSEASTVMIQVAKMLRRSTIRRRRSLGCGVTRLAAWRIGRESASSSLGVLRVVDVAVVSSSGATGRMSFI